MRTDYRLIFIGKSVLTCALHSVFLKPNGRSHLLLFPDVTNVISKMVTVGVNVT